MLSIQYVYERVILFLFAYQTPLPLLVLAAAKVQLFFKPASFFKKNFFLFFQLTKVSLQLFNPQFLSVWEGKDNIFFLFNPSFF